MNSWQQDKNAADRFMPEARRVLAELFIRPADLHADLHEATDLKVFTIAPLTVAWRHRSADYLYRFPFDVTIRTSRPSGAKTEFAKILEGWGDFFLYSFGSIGAPHFLAYRILSLAALRAQVAVGPPLRSRDLVNCDGSSGFRAYDTRAFAPGVQLRAWPQHLPSAPARQSLLFRDVGLR